MCIHAKDANDLQVAVLSQRRDVLSQSPFDRDFPSLAGRSTASKPWHSGNNSSEQQWTRLADAPDGAALSPRISNSRLAEPADPVKALGSKLASGPDGAALSPRLSNPRLADPAEPAKPQGSKLMPGPLDACSSTSQLRMADTLQQVGVNKNAACNGTNAILS